MHLLVSVAGQNARHRGKQWGVLEGTPEPPVKLMQGRCRHRGIFLLYQASTAETDFGTAAAEVRVLRLQRF
jgi:hypothetical protein